MRTTKNILGVRFGRLKPLAEYVQFKRRKFLCLCACGKEVFVSRSNIVSGHTLSCGCFKAVATRTHGMSRTRTYYAWQNMHQRCKVHKNWAGRGIKVCRQWSKFENFLADMGEMPKGMSLNRVNNDGDYCLKNCKWADGVEQSNNKRTNRFLTYCGESLTVKQWSDRLSINCGTLYNRLRLGWTEGMVLSEPVDIRMRRKRQECQTGL